MLILITIVHIIVCLILVVVVLLQSGKAADLAGAFGGMGSQTWIVDQDANDFACPRRDNVVERLHRLNQQQLVSKLHN